MVLLMAFWFTGKALKAHAIGLPPLGTGQHMLSCSASHLDQLYVQITTKSQMPREGVRFTPNFTTHF